MRTPKQYLEAEAPNLLMIPQQRDIEEAVKDYMVECVQASVDTLQKMLTPTSIERIKARIFQEMITTKDELRRTLIHEHMRHNWAHMFIDGIQMESEPTFFRNEANARLAGALWAIENIYKIDLEDLE